MNKLQTFEKYTSEPKGITLSKALKTVKEAIKDASEEELEKARYVVADIKAKIEAKLK